MTCLEKFRQDHPHNLMDDEAIIDALCPDCNNVDIMDEPDWCHCGSCADADDGSCTKCWNRQIPGTEPTNIDITPDGTGIPIPKIKDSGERRQFDTGAVRDIQEGKGRCDLMPLDVVTEITGDPVIAYIAKFAETGDRGHLRMALDVFAGSNYFDMLLEVAKHFEDGAKKYGENNWQKGIPVRCYIDSAVRHYLKYQRGDKDEPHNRAFCWNIITACWTCKHKPELNDYAQKTRQVPVTERDPDICGYEEEGDV
jgi:hypothetical protein